MISSDKMTCGCGYGKPSICLEGEKEPKLHPLGEDGCCRKLATGDLVPTNFRMENGMKMCSVNGYSISVYTLKEQRGYGKHLNGHWSLPKSEESTNSLEGNW